MHENARTYIRMHTYIHVCVEMIVWYGMVHIQLYVISICTCTQQEKVCI